jgi:hypothetical protein
MKYPDVFVDVYMPIAGWKPRVMAVDEDCDGMHTPWQTYPFAFNTKREAIAAACDWADEQGLKFFDTCPEQVDDAPDKTVTEQLLEIFG